MRLYCWLLHLCPAGFRAEYGDEMAAVFAHRLAAERSALPRLLVWASALGDLFTTALAAHADVLRQDLRYALREFIRAPRFTITALLVAALGSGATTAVVTLADHVLVRPLPFADADRLVNVWDDDVAHGYSRSEPSPPNWRDWQRMQSVFEAMPVWRGLSVNLVGEGSPERLDGAAVTADLLPMLGVSPVFGRLFSPEDDRAGAPGTVLLSYGLWQRMFGGDRGVVGRPMILDGERYTVIGVMPASFYYPSRRFELWTAMRFSPADFTERTNHYLHVVAKLRAGVTLAQARAGMRLVAARLEREYPRENAGLSISVIPLHDELSPRARLLLQALLAAGLCVLLIGCANLAQLLLVRALGRRKELAVRTALGAGKDRLIRQLLTESLLLAAFGGLLGALLATTVLSSLTQLVPIGLPIAQTPAVDGRVLTFALLSTVVTGLGFGVLPALWAARGDALQSGLREGSRSGVGGHRERLRGLLVVAEVTVSIALLITSGLLIRALVRLQGVDPGFRAEGVLTLRTALPMDRYQQVERRERFYRSVLQEVRALPGVQQAAYTSFLPMVMPGGIQPVRMAGQPEGDARLPYASLRFVTPGYFAALGIPIRRGRDIEEQDQREAPWVAVVSESFAREHCAGREPLGQRFHFVEGLRTIVGVVGEVRVRGLEAQSEPQVYLPHRQVGDGNFSWYAPKDLVIRSAADPNSLIPAVRSIIARADPQQPVSDVRLLTDVVEAETAARRVQVRVLGAFAAVAFLLTAVGIHGLLSFAVSQRTPEFGVRLALGARPSQIMTMVLKNGLGLAAIGTVLGIGLAYLAGRTLEALLMGVAPTDGPAFLTGMILALLMAGLGSLLPAARAVRVDPLTALRAE